MTTKKESKFVSLIKSDGFKSLLSSIVSILIGLLVGFIAMVVITMVSPNNSISDAFGGLKIMFSGPFSSSVTKYVLSNTGNMVFYAVPLIFTDRKSVV